MSTTEPLIERNESIVVDGTLIGRFHLYQGERPSAELFERAVDAERAATAIVGQLPGWTLTTTDDDLARELTARSAVSTRRYSLMSIDLASPGSAEALASAGVSSVLDSVAVTADTEVTEGLVELIRRAYPPGHPDAELGTDVEIAADISHTLNGNRIGTLMSESRLVLDDGRPVALAMLNRVPGRAPTGGPWLTDICRDPSASYSGLGRMLLADVLRQCHDDGEPTVSLAVTEGNAARRLYESVGFTHAATTQKLRLPG